MSSSVCLALHFLCLPQSTSYFTLLILPRTSLSFSSVSVFLSVFHTFCFPERCSRRALKSARACFPSCFAMFLSPPSVFPNVFHTFCFPERCSRRALKSGRAYFPSCFAMLLSPPSVFLSVFHTFGLCCYRVSWLFSYYWHAATTHVQQNP